MITFKNAESVLKTVYLNAVTDQLNTAVNPFYTMIAKTTKDVVGKEVVRLVRKSLPSGISYPGADDADLPTPKLGQFATFKSTLKNLFGQIQITDKALKASANSEGAFVNLLNDEMEGLLKSAQIMLGRMLYMGRAGQFGVFEEGTGSPAFSHYSFSNYVKGASGSETCYRRDVIGGPYIQMNATVAKEQIVNGKYEVDFTSAFNAYKDGVISLSSDGNAMITGLGHIFDPTATLYGVTRSDNPWTLPYEHNADYEEKLTEDLLQQVFDEVTERSGDSPDIILTSFHARRELVKDLNSFRRNIDYMDVQGGFKALSFNGIPVVADRYCPIERMYLLNSKDFALHQLGDWQWIENESGNVLHQMPTKAAYRATLVKYAELVCDRPFAQGAITKIKLV